MMLAPTIFASILVIAWLIYTRGKPIDPMEELLDRTLTPVYRRRHARLAQKLTGHFRAAPPKALIYDLNLRTLNGVGFGGGMDDLAPFGRATSAGPIDSEHPDLIYGDVGLRVDFDEQGPVHFVLYFESTATPYFDQTNGCKQLELIRPDHSKVVISQGSTLHDFEQIFGRDDEPICQDEANELVTEYECQGTFMVARHSRDGKTLRELELSSID